MDYIKTINKFTNILNRKISKKRFYHSVKVAEMSKKIAVITGFNSEKAYFAGLIHDIAKEISRDKLYLFDYSEFSDEFRRLPQLFHGPYGAYLLEKEYEISDLEILESVKLHSVGRENISTLGKIVYVADYISEDRNKISDNFREKVLSQTLDKMVLSVVIDSREFLKLREKDLTPETISMYNELSKEVL